MDILRVDIFSDCNFLNSVLPKPIITTEPKFRLQKNNKEHSDTKSIIFGQKNCSSKWTPNLSFKELQKFVSPIDFINNLCEESTEIDYFSLLVNREFCDHIAIETNKYVIQCQSEKPDLKWEETNGIEIQVY